jgi:biopolymer transport protein ExbB
MNALVAAWYANRDFLENGGWVLVAIGIATFLMWMMILERYWYLYTGHRALVRRILERWNARTDTTSWYAHQIRRAMISEVALKLNETIPVIKTLVAVCPLFGLLGTVTGMIEVFEVMAIAGSGNARAMASGVSRATIPTMAGMVASLSGLVFSVQLEKRAKIEAEQMAEHLVPDRGSATTHRSRPAATREPVADNGGHTMAAAG